MKAGDFRSFPNSLFRKYIDSMHFQAMHYSSFIKNIIAFNNFSGGFPKGYKILNSKGEIIFNSNESYFLYQYTNYDPLENGYAIVSDKTSRGIINNDGKIVLKLSFENKDLSECGEGIFVRKKSDTLEFITANGNRLFVIYNVIPEYYLKSFKILTLQ